MKTRQSQQSQQCFHVLSAHCNDRFLRQLGGKAETWIANFMPSPKRRRSQSYLNHDYFSVATTVKGGKKRIRNAFPISLAANSEPHPNKSDGGSLMGLASFHGPFSRFPVYPRPTFSIPPTSFPFHQSPACVSLHLRLHLALAAEYEMKLV